MVDGAGIRTSLRVDGGASVSDMTFKAHLHAAPCSAAGGGHYQDPDNQCVVDGVSENWPGPHRDPGVLGQPRVIAIAIVTFNSKVSQRCGGFDMLFWGCYFGWT